MPSIEFPWPPPKLMPNYKRSHHWTAYHKPARSARTLGWGLTVQASREQCGAWNRGPNEEWPIAIEATPPMRAGPVPDEDNLKGALKHYLDGMADALGVNDKQFRFAAIQWRPKEGAGKIVISFE